MCRHNLANGGGFYSLHKISIEAQGLKTPFNFQFTSIYQTVYIARRMECPTISYTEKVICDN